MVEAIINKEFEISDEAKQLNKNPIPIKHESHYHIQKPGILQQIDIMTLPKHKDFHSLLLVIDINNRLCDGRPLVSGIKGRIDDYKLIGALKNIYNPSEKYIHDGNLDGDDFSEFYRKASNGAIIPWLKKPEILQGGNEFNGSGFIDWCNENGIKVKLSSAYRSNQNAYIEGINSWFRRQINQYLLSKSILSGTKITNWVYCVMKLIQTRNQFIVDEMGSDTRKYIIPDHIAMNPKTSYLIENGTKIKIRLDTPLRLYPNKHGKYKLDAKSDGHTSIIHRWSKNEYEIAESVLIPGNPPLYFVKNIETGKKLNALYPAEQILILPP